MLIDTSAPAAWEIVTKYVPLVRGGMNASRRQMCKNFVNTETCTRSRHLENISFSLETYLQCGGGHPSSYQFLITWACLA